MADVKRLHLLRRGLRRIVEAELRLERGGLQKEMVQRAMNKHFLFPDEGSSPQLSSPPEGSKKPESFSFQG